MIYIDVDTAVEVPVNAVPLIDDTDFKTRETGVAYNAAGMDLVWNFVTPDGTITQTAVTPTTGGVYDWAEIGDAMYKIEIPASGGGSINNDTEGVGYFTGIATGILPWRGPNIVFRAAGINDALIESAWDANRGLAGIALPSAAADAAGGLPISDSGALDLDTILGRITGNVALSSVVGALNDAAAAGDPSATDTLMQYLKQLINILVGTSGINSMPASSAPADGVSLAEMIRAIYDDSDALDGRLTAARAALLDKLNISGSLVADGDELANITNNTRAVVVCPRVMRLPDSGSVVYKVRIGLFDTEGNAEAPDSAPTISAEDEAGNDRDSNLDATTMTLVSTGRYEATYTVASTHDKEQVVFELTVIEGGATRIYDATTIVVDDVDIGFTASDRTSLGNIEADTNELQADWADGGRLDAILDSRASQSSVDTVDSNVDTINSNVTTLLGRITSTLFNGITSLGSWLGALAGKTADASTEAEIQATTAGAGYSIVTDSQEALRDNQSGGGGGSDSSLLQNTTIATLASQTSFTLAAGSADDDVYNGAMIIITDSATSTQKAYGRISDYVGSTKTVTLTAALGFTVAVGDTVDIVADSSQDVLDRGSTGPWTGSGGVLTGDWTVTITANDGVSAIEGAKVRLHKSLAETETLTADENGQVVFSVEAATWTVVMNADGYNGITQTLVVTGDTNQTYSLTATSVTPPADPSLCTVTVKCVDQAGAVEKNATIKAEIIEIPTGSTGIAFDAAVNSGDSNASGIATLILVRQAKYRISRGSSKWSVEVTIPDSATATLSSFIGED